MRVLLELGDIEAVHVMNMGVVATREIHGRVETLGLHVVTVKLMTVMDGRRRAYELKQTDGHASCPESHIPGNA